jgi:hypothetical protein
MIVVLVLCHIFVVGPLGEVKLAQKYPDMPPLLMID